MFGIGFCDVQMKSRCYLKFSTNVFMVESLVSLVIKFQLWYSSSSLSSFKENFLSTRNMFYKFPIPVAGVVQIMDTGLKDTYIKSKSKKKNIRFKHESKMNFPFNFLRLLEQGETLEKNGGAGSHTWQLRKKT